MDTRVTPNRVLRILLQFVLAGLLLVGMFAAFFHFGVFTDRKRLPRYEALVGQAEHRINEVLGPPLRTFRDANEAGFPLPGFRTPTLPEWDRCYVYQERYGMVYIAVRRGHVVHVEYAGG